MLYNIYKKSIKWSDTKESWYFSFYHNNRRIYRDSVTWTKSKKYLAEDKLRDVCEKLESKPSVTKRTLDQVFDEYVDFRTLSVRENTILANKRVYNKHIKSELGKLEVEGITLVKINNYFKWFLTQTFGDGEYYSNNIISKVQTLLNQVLHYAYINSYTTSNVMQLLPKIKHSRVEEVFSRTHVSFDDVIKVINHLDTPTYKTALSISLYTGMRPSEIFGLNYSDDNNLYFTVNRSYSNETQKMGPPKNGKPRMVPIPNDLRIILDEYYEHTKKLDPTESSPLIGTTKRQAKSTIDRSIKAAIKKADVPNFSWYDLRGTLITDLLESGAQAYVIAKSAGHNKSETTDTYAIVQIEKQAEIINNMLETRNQIHTISIPFSLKD